MTKQKEPITQNIRNRREHSSRFKVMFYVIGSEKSKSGSASYNSRRQNQRRGGAVRYFRCTDTVPDKSDFHKICLNISIFSFRVDKLSTTLLYKQRHRLSRFAQEMFVGSAVSFLWTGAAALFAVAPWLPYSRDGHPCQRRAKPVYLDRWHGRSALLSTNETGRPTITVDRLWLSHYLIFSIPNRNYIVRQIIILSITPNQNFLFQHRFQNDIYQYRGQYPRSGLPLRWWLLCARHHWPCKAAYSVP